MMTAEYTHVWRIRLAVYVSKYSVSAPDGGIAQVADLRSRMPDQAMQYGDITVAIRKPSMEIPHRVFGKDPRIEQIELAADVPAGGEPSDAIHRFAPVSTAVTDLMSFTMGVALYAGQVMVTDITPPIAVGDQRRAVAWSEPTFDTPRSVEMGAIRGELLGSLPESLDLRESKTAAVLRWFVKSLGTDLLHDRFIFLWIALEILCDASDIKVEAPYVGPCQHRIESCPECGRETTRLVRGATLKKYLTDCGVSEVQAAELWSMRQLMHGAIPFDSKKLLNLGVLVQPLRAVVAANLKERLGISPDAFPQVGMSGPALHPAMGMVGHFEVIDEDISPLISPPEGPAPK